MLEAMYESGLVKWTGKHGELDERGLSDDDSAAYKQVHGAYLPHSCGEWVIGGREQIQQLIRDLSRLLSEHP